MLQNIVNKRNDIINRQIIRRAIINNYSDNNIFISIDKFSDYGSRQVTGYYGQNDNINQSNFVSMVSSELNNEEDKNMDVSHKLPLPNKKVYKSLPYNSKPVSNFKGTDKILHKFLLIIKIFLFYYKLCLNSLWIKSRCTRISLEIK